MFHHRLWRRPLYEWNSSAHLIWTSLEASGYSWPQPEPWLVVLGWTGDRSSAELHTVQVGWAGQKEDHIWIFSFKNDGWSWVCLCAWAFTGGVCVSLPLLASLLRMLLSDICRRAAIGGTLDSVAGSRVTSAFISLRSSSSWLRTAIKHGSCPTH